MKSSAELSECIGSVDISNFRNIELRFDLEPWDEQFNMPPGATFTVIGKGPESGCLEVRFYDDRIAVHGWVGSIVSVFHNGVQLGGS